jgi:hypothetical protein
MAYAHAAPDHERLPWLKNEKKAAPKSETPLLVGWGLVALSVVAGASYWLGMSDAQPLFDGPGVDVAPSATVRLPEPQKPAPAAEVTIPAMPEVKPSPAPAEVKVARARRAKQRPRKIGPMERDAALPAVVAAQKEKASAPENEAADKAEEKAPERKPVTYWPASVSENAYGRVVRIGTFSSRLQAKRAWWKVVKVYPGMKSLKAVVAPVPSYRNGRTYYRLQFGTTSQAHSEILCQRMRIVRVSCSVVGLPATGGTA